MQKRKKRLKIFDIEFVYLYLFGMIIAFLGWLIENISISFSMGIIDSRYHLLPFISPYALIIFAFHIVFKDADDITFFGKKLFKENNKRNKFFSNLICYILICLCVFLGELMVGHMWEILFGVELWNYSSEPLHITKYTSLISTFGFGTGAYLIFKFLYKPVLNRIRKINFKYAKLITSTLGVLIVLDTLFLMFQIIFFHEAPIYWTIYLR